MELFSYEIAIFVKVTREFNTLISVMVIANLLWTQYKYLLAGHQTLVMDMRDWNIHLGYRNISHIHPDQHKPLDLSNIYI